VTCADVQPQARRLRNRRPEPVDFTLGSFYLHPRTLESGETAPWKGERMSLAMRFYWAFAFVAILAAYVPD
jgi:hypothetical protein